MFVSTSKAQIQVLLSYLPGYSYYVSVFESLIYFMYPAQSSLQILRYLDDTFPSVLSLGKLSDSPGRTCIWTHSL